MLRRLYRRYYLSTNYRYRTMFGGRFVNWCRPTWISILLTNHCNARCVHCDIWKNRGVEEKLSIDEYKKFLGDLRKWLGPVHVHVTGGEALLTAHAKAASAPSTASSNRWKMEEAGQVRRGWFVDGLSGAQFAAAGVIDRLRAERIDEPPLDGFTEDQVRILAAADPANPYGALLPWPSTTAEGPPPKRVAGAWLILVAGQPVLCVGAGRRTLTSFAAASVEQGNALTLALDALHRLPADGRRRLLIQQIDGQPALESPLREPLLAAGFETDYDALTPARISRAGIGRDPNALACA